MSYYFEGKIITADQLAFIRMLVDKYGSQVQLSNLSIGEQKKFSQLFSEFFTSGGSKQDVFRKLFTGEYKVIHNGEEKAFKVI